MNRSPSPRSADVTTCRLFVKSLWLLLAGCAALLAAASSTPLETNGQIAIGGGYESNLFRRPAVMDTGTGVYNPVESDGLLWSRGQVKPTLTLDQQHRLQAQVDAGLSLYPSHATANEAAVLGDLEYRFRPARHLNLKISGGGGYVRQLAVDETANEATALYKYWQYGGGARIELSPSRTLDADFTYQFLYKDYEERDTLASLDNQQHEVVASIAPRFGDKDRSSTITAEGSYQFKRYRELLSYDAAAAILPGYPLRTYHNLSLLIGFKHDFGTIVWDISERPRYRIDAFEDFYTYFENRLSTGIDASFTKTSRLKFDAAWRYRHYVVREAARPGVNPKLLNNYVDVNAGFRQTLWKELFLVIDYDLSVRLTNTGYTSFHSYREYTNHTARAGMGWGW